VGSTAEEIKQNRILLNGEFCPIILVNIFHG